MSLNFGKVEIWSVLLPLLRIAVGLAGLGLLGVAFQERHKKAARVAAGIGAAVIFAALAANLIWYLFAAA